MKFKDIKNRAPSGFRYLEIKERVSTGDLCSKNISVQNPDKSFFIDALNYSLITNSNYLGRDMKYFYSFHPFRKVIRKKFDNSSILY